jgi:hypothetical protein
LTKFTVIPSSTAKSSKVGNSVQLSLKTVGSKAVALKLVVKAPDSKSYTLSNLTIAKNKAYVGPIIRFSRPGTYVFTLSMGSTNKSFTIKVSK